MTNTIDRSVLDEDVRFSRTHMWRMQRAFYETSGVKCWQDLIVPNFISSNTFLAHAYARCVLAFLLDHYATADAAAASTQPVHIIEIGSGAGKFSYVLLHKLLALRKHWPRTHHGGLPFKYIITGTQYAFYELLCLHQNPVQGVIILSIVCCKRLA
jgi:hypothetical protein